MSKKPTVLMILDGYGLNERKDGNAVAEAATPVMDGLMKEYPFVAGNASGMAVGLPEGQMGNSEVGHLNMGAGRIVYQELTRITKETIVKPIIPPFICLGWCPMAVYTAITHIFMVFWNWPKETACPKYMRTVSWMGGILLRKAEKAM